MVQRNPQTLRVALPKGRMQAGVLRLLEDAGVPVRTSARDYRPSLALADTDTKLLKPQSVVEMLDVGTRDVGFAGADWVGELGAELVELLDTGLDPVRVVAAAPTSILVDGALPARPLVVASEYVRLTQDWIARQGLDARFLRSWGATEVLPPEDADCIVDNTATGSTLAANRLSIVDELMRSSTRLWASREALDDPTRRARIESLALVLRSVVDARRRAMVEVNVPEACLAAIVEFLPCMRRPTVSRLHGETAFAVRAAVPRAGLAELVPALKARGATDVVISRVDQIVP